MILVIGAGASGLMAAMDLLASGKEVLVLEASSRIGGRIHTVPAGSPGATRCGDGGTRCGGEGAARFGGGGDGATPVPVPDAVFPYSVEAGAEFVHGDLPLTFELLHAADITATPTSGKFYRSYEGLG
jgi:phytoene dehydrogenase-like protein